MEQLLKRVLIQNQWGTHKMDRWWDRSGEVLEVLQQHVDEG